MSKKPADKYQVGGSHYRDMPIQPWEVMQSIMTPNEFRGFLRGNIIKYAMRAGAKGDEATDIQKMIHYAEKYLEVACDRPSWQKQLADEKPKSVDLPEPKADWV